MLARFAVVVAGPLFIASLAHAQAPGEVPVQAPPEMVLQPAPSVMDNRWAIGFSFGSMSLVPEHSDADTAFGIGELAVRFRATPHLELALSAGGGRDHHDGMEGDLEVTQVAFAARYRFMPEAAWNWYAMAGIGAAAVTWRDASDEERDDATHPMIQLGLGLERRFEHFALQAEARIVGIGSREKDDAMPANVDDPTTLDPRQRLSGGALTVGASYYF